MLLAYLAQTTTSTCAAAKGENCSTIDQLQWGSQITRAALTYVKMCGLVECLLILLAGQAWIPADDYRLQSKAVVGRFVTGSSTRSQQEGWWS